MFSEGVDEEVQVVYLAHFLNEEAHICQEFFWVDIVKEIYIDFVRSKSPECFPVSQSFDVCNSFFQHDESRVDAFKVASGQLQDCLGCMNYDNS